MSSTRLTPMARPGWVPPVRQMLRRSYLANRVAQELMFRFAPLYRRNPLIIYQMGKVGSETIERSLASYDLNRPVYRAHALVKQHLQQGLQSGNVTRRAYFKRSRHLLHAERLARELARDLHRGDWQVISMVRDPIAQNVSSFFQIIDLLMPDFAARAAKGSVDLDELMAKFLEQYPPDSVFNRWFDVEMRPAFDIDVFATPFAHERGYQIYREPHVQLLVMRLEDIDRAAPEAIREFLGIDGFVVRRTNEASAKDYFSIYRRFRQEAVFPASYVDAVYASKQARHFYTDSEIDGFRQNIRVEGGPGR